MFVKTLSEISHDIIRAYMRERGALNDYVDESDFVEAAWSAADVSISDEDRRLYVERTRIALRLHVYGTVNKCTRGN